MQIAERLGQITPSMTLAINARAQELRGEGVDVISLAVGEPDFNTPEFIREAAKKAIDDNFTRYTPVCGIPELRKAAGHYFERYYNTPVAPESIIFGAGGKQCLYTFIQATINPGDEVLIPTPCWVSYPDMVRLAGGVPVFVPAGSDAGYKVTALQLEKYTTEKTKLLILNSPSNPTGAVYSDGEFMRIMRWALARTVYVLSDEIYDQLVYPPAQMTSAITWFANCPEFVGVVNGLSKSYAMTGWRAGFMAAHPEIIKKMAVVQGHSLSNATSITQKAALAALTGPDDCVREMRDTFAKRRNLAMDIVAGWTRATCPRPDGAFYLFPDVSGYYNDQIANSVDFCAMLLERAHVACVPGAAFGNDACIRLSYAASDDNIKKGLNRIGEVLTDI